VVRADLTDEATLLHGVVAQDRTAAVFCWARLATSPDGESGRVPIPGIAADLDYRLRIRTEIGEPSWHHQAPAAWVAEALTGWITVPGIVLTAAGLPMPTLNPQQAMLLDLRAA
jgi:alpha-galactosidase